MVESTYTRNLAAKAMVLRSLSGAPLGVLGQDLLLTVENASRELGRTREDFDFVYWANGTVWDVLGMFVRCGFVQCSGEPQDPQEWKLAKLRITDRGEKFLASAVAVAQPALGAIVVDREVEFAAG